jgi:hypothetical protein
MLLHSVCSTKRMSVGTLQMTVLFKEVIIGTLVVYFAYGSVHILLRWQCLIQLLHAHAQCLLSPVNIKMCVLFHSRACGS